jgi:hypothetical protein
MLTEFPATVHCPDALKVTVRPEEAVAVTAKSASPKVLVPSGAKLMV